VRSDRQAAAIAFPAAAQSSSVTHGWPGPEPEQMSGYGVGAGIRVAQQPSGARWMSLRSEGAMSS